MAKKEVYSLIFAPVVHNHLGAIDAKYDSLIRHKLEEQLTHEPDVHTRNRKPVQPPSAFQAEWELRFGPNNRFRVFYQIDRDKREGFITRDEDAAVLADLMGKTASGQPGSGEAEKPPGASSTQS